MQLTSLDKVKVGSTITVGGESYTVKQNWTSDLVLSNRNGNESYFSRLVNGQCRGAGHLVVVTSEVAQGGVVKGGLADELRQQMTTESLRRQVGATVGKQQVVATSQTDLTENLKRQALTLDLKAQAAVGQDIFTGTVTTQQVGDVNGVKIGALNAKVDTVRGQVAETRVQVSALNGKVDAIAGGVESYAYETETRLAYLEESVEDLVDVVNDPDSDVEYIIEELEARINALESAEEQRSLQARLNEVVAKNKVQVTQNQGGQSPMKNLLGSFKNLFGKVEGQFALSMFGGIAVRKAALSPNWVTYKEGEGITDVQENVLKFDVPAFRLPVEPKAVKKGNIVVSQDGKYGYVTEVADGFVRVVFPATAAQGTVLPVRNPLLNKSFYTVVQVIDFTSGNTGGFNPMLLMAMSGEGNKSDLLPLLLASGGLAGKEGQIDPMTLMMISDGADDILPLLLLQQGGVGTKDGINPLMLLALSDKGGKGSKGKDLLPLLLMSQGAQGGQAGAINPMMLMAMSGEGGDFKDILMMQALSGQNLFGATPATDEKPKA